jgi:KDO2-lipid IV(A) lauroyltransferase
VKSIKHILEFVLALKVSVLLRVLPRSARLALGRFAGELVYAVDRRHRAITVDNVATALGPSKTADESRAIARNAFRHFGAMLFELLSLRASSWREFEPLFEFEGVSRFEKARSRGKGVILVAAHFGNWELHAIAHGYKLGPIHLVARAQDNKFFNSWLEKIRGLSGNHVVYKQRALGQMKRLLRAGETIAFVIDQNVRQEDAVFVDFFGRKAATTPVASWFALKTGAALVPVFCYPREDGSYRAVYEGPIDTAPYRDLPREEAIQALTQELVSLQEEYIRERPGLWLWMHRRWKTQPEDGQAEIGAKSNGGARSGSRSLPRSSSEADAVPLSQPSSPSPSPSASSSASAPPKHAPASHLR